MQEMIDQMNACLLVGMISPKCQSIIDEYYGAMASISKSHPPEWRELTQESIHNQEEKQKISIVCSREVFETMYQCMFNDVSEITEGK